MQLKKKCDFMLNFESADLNSNSLKKTFLITINELCGQFYNQLLGRWFLLRTDRTAQMDK